MLPGTDAIDVDHGRKAFVLLHGADVSKALILAQARHQPAPPLPDNGAVAARNRVLELTEARAGRDLHILYRFGEHDEPGNPCKRSFNLPCQLSCRPAARFMRLEHDRQGCNVGDRVDRSAAGSRDRIGDLNQAENGLNGALLQPCHLRERHIGIGFDDESDKTRILLGKKALGHDHIKSHRDSDCRDRYY